MIPFVRPNLPQINSKDIINQREVEKQFKLIQKSKSTKRWGAGQQIASAYVGLSGFDKDLAKIDEYKKIKEQYVKIPFPRQHYLKLANKEEKKRNQHRNAFQGSTSVSPARGGVHAGAGSQGPKEQANSSVGAAMLLLADHSASPKNRGKQGINAQ